LLGHAKLTTTEVYTLVSIRKLIEVHARTHPGATLKRKPEASAEEPEPGTTAEALNEQLEDEAAEEDGVMAGGSDEG
jgi:integrase/recombinase XerD